ncbi:hypothetical protein BKA64DRAFT_537799, partial [Cadophora sp. MPI-SDFR-AT-0126]
IQAGFLPTKDNRFDYDLAGGSLMDVGTYSIASLRDVFHDEPVKCTSATARLMPKPSDQRVDVGFGAEFKFPNGGIGTVEADLACKTWLGLPSIKMPKIVVKCRDVEIDDGPGSPKHIMSRTITFWGFLFAHFWHRIQVCEKHVWSESGTGKVIKKKEEKRNLTAYIWDEGEKKGDAHWTTYRYMLDEFVCRIRGEKGTGAWIDGEDSVNQMKMIDSGYVKAGLPLRPTN